jgi:pimeloyl-ACP methyl ester carboxylesterase
LPFFVRDDVTIYYETRGSGAPLLLLAPGGLQSTVDAWQLAAINPWADYGDGFQLIAMDQRNCGRSSGPLDAEDPWGSYAIDQLALLTHLGVDHFLVLGCCIGGSFALRLIEESSHRVVAAVLQQPIGITDVNRGRFDGMWRAWGRELLEGRSDLDMQTLERFGQAMWDADFVSSVSRSAVAGFDTPMLVLPGIDDIHPGEVGREIALLARAATVVEPWKDTPENIAAASGVVRRFLQSYAAVTPS